LHLYLESPNFKFKLYQFPESLMTKQVIFTIGHSTHSLEVFLDLLQAHGINHLIDVRSVAASKYNPQFNKAPLTGFLKNHGIQYLHFGQEFGARHTEAEVLDAEGRVDFDLIRQTPAFISGMERMQQLLEKQSKVVLMCSESDPMECHRFSMIAFAVEQASIEVQHILKDKTLISNIRLENQLLKKFSKKIPHPDLFNPDITMDDQLRAAYRLHNIEVAYSPATPENGEQNEN
jgi:hypothetical protein